MPQRKSGHVTLSDVAHASGLSVSTVSIVLSEALRSRHVAASTRDRVRAMAQQLGYHPDAYARSLRRRSTQTIGVLAFDLSDPFCVPLLRGIEAGLHAADYLPLVMDAQTQRKLFDRYLSLMLERRAEAVIVIASWVFEEANLLEDMRKNKVPTIIVGRDLTARGIPSILVDNEAGGALAMEHLHALGHREIAVILGPKQMSDSRPRWLGIERAAAKHGISLHPELVLSLSGSADPLSAFEGGRRLARKMLRTRRAFTAVLAFDDLTALGVVRQLTEAGIRVPEDCSVMGFDDVLPAHVATPAITTIRQPLRRMGLDAAEHVLKAVNRPGRHLDRVYRLEVTPELVPRMSTAPPGRSAAKSSRSAKLSGFA